MRILFCAWRDTVHPRAGGSEVLIDRLADGLAERGHDVTLLAGRPAGSHRRYRVVGNGGELTQYLRAPFAYRRLRPFDLVVDVANGTGFYPALWSRVPTVALVNHLHTPQWDLWFSRPVATLGRALERHLLPWAHRRDLVVAVSPSTARDLVDIGVPSEHIAVVPNGVDLPIAPAAEADEPTFLALGRLVPHKRHDLLLDLWERVRPHTGGRLVIAGAGPERDRLRAKAGPGVEVRGQVSEPEKAELLGRAWALLHPSVVEGWGLAVMEAAAYGTPALAFDTAGVRDSIVDGGTGVLAGTEAAFVDAWIRLGTDTAERHRLGAAARRRAADYPWSRTVEAFEAVAEAAVARGRGGVAEDLRRIPAYEGWRPSVTDTAMARLGRALEPSPRRAVDPGSRRELFRLFLAEKRDPDPFYRALAERSVADLPHRLPGARLLDLGCGHGAYTHALRAAGAHVVAVDRSREALGDGAAGLRPAAVADGGALPFPDRSFDGVFCSNLLEHTPTPARIFDELARVLVPGGWAWVSWTNWWSPWGGHEIVPLHLLGPRLGLATWRRLFGEPRKNVPFVELWPTHIGPTLRLVRAHRQLALVDAVPRYYPSQRWITRVPGLREVATWNCLLQLERR